MRPRNFYVVLGISPQATQDNVRSAYRRLAKLHHPDMGAAEASRFQEITEAYKTLSDPQSRRAHNRALDAMTDAPRSSTADEPLAEPLSLRRGFRSSRPSLEDELIDWTMRHSLGRGLEKSGRQQPVHIDVILSRDEARRGGTLPIEIPMFAPCRRCGGRGLDWFASCGGCDGTGISEQRLTLRVQLPPGIRDETVWTASAAGVGLTVEIAVRVD